MDNLNIKAVHICRTCTEEIINAPFCHLDFTHVDNEPTIRQKLSKCIPELDLSIVPNAVICGKCADTINSLYIFKEECLQLEMQICEYIRQVQHTGNAIDLAAVMQFHQLHSKSLTVELKTEAFEKTEYYKNTSSCDNCAFNETGGCPEIVNKKYLTSLPKVDRDECVLFNTVDNFNDPGKSEVEENSNTHDDSNVVQDCLLQVVKNPDSYMQNLSKTDIYYQCSTCGHKAESKLQLIRHLESHRGNKLYQNKIPSKSHKSLRCWHRCDLCNYSSKHKCIFSFHNRAHLTKKDYRHILKSSPVLVKTSTITFGRENKNNISKLKMNTNITVKPFKCWLSEICDFSSNYKHKLKIHMLTHRSEKLFKCSVCEYTCNHKQSLKAHMLTHTFQKLFKCSICEYSCNHKLSLKNHMLTHTGEKPFKCSVCGYSCSRKHNLNSHMLTHTGEKPFKCSVCEYSCNQIRHLKSHILTHTGEKPFKCLICQYNCIRKNDLKSHMLTHTGENPFKCSVCEYSCNHKHNLKSHMLIHTGEKPFKCSACEYSCNQKSNLKRHMLTHKYKCKYCSTTRNQLKIRMQNHS